MTTSYEVTAGRCEPTRQPIRVPWSPKEADVVSWYPSSFHFVELCGGPTVKVDLAELATKKAFLTNISSGLDWDLLSVGSQELFNQPVSGFAAFASVQDSVSELTSRIHELADQVSALADRLEVPDERNVVIQAALQQPDLTKVLGAELVGDDWVDLFDHIADGHPTDRTDVKELAKEALQSSDQAVRSAAARALAVLDPKQASQIIEKLLPKEANKYVRSAFESALASAAL